MMHGMDNKNYHIDSDNTSIAAEPVATYGVRDNYGWFPPELDYQQGAPQEVGRMDIGVKDEQRAAKRAEWSRENFETLMAEAEKKCGYARGNNYTVEQYFSILRYLVEKGYEAVPED